MFFPTTNDLTWDSTDAAQLRAFLETPVGERALRILQGRIPSLLDGGDSFKTLVRSGEVKGAQFIFNSLISLVLEQPAELQPTPTPPPEAYPDLDTDKFWKEPETIPAP